MLLRARRVVPISSPPIEDGVVIVEEDRIAFVGAHGHEPLQGKNGPSINLGDAVLLPGLVNAHCHLEHSALKGLTTPGPSFTAWVKDVTRETAALTLGDLRAGVRHAIASLIQGGSTVVADHAHPDSEVLETPFRRILFWEVLGAHEGRARESLDKARRRALSEGGFVTPHSLYAVHEEVLEAIFRGGTGRSQGSPLHSIHILESSEEDQFFRRQAGPLAIYVQERGGDLSFPVSSPVQWLAANRWLNEGTLLVHGNHLNSAEIEALRASGSVVIHCPGSHRFFGHKRFPLEDLKAAGVRVVLGTDSLASNEDLSMLREMRLLKEAYPSLADDEILRMATLDGARALGLEKETGSLEAGKKADLIAVKRDVFEADRVVFSMVDGKVVLNDVGAG